MNKKIAVVTGGSGGIGGSICEALEKEPELAKEYDLQLDYFKQYFYKGAEGRKDMHRYIHTPPHLSHP